MKTSDEVFQLAASRRGLRLDITRLMCSKSGCNARLAASPDNGSFATVARR